MEKLDIILWVMGSGFGLMLVMWRNLNDLIDSVEKGLGSRIDKLDEKITDIDRRLCRIEGAMASKDCCILKEDRQERHKRAE